MPAYICLIYMCVHAQFWDRVCGTYLDREFADEKTVKRSQAGLKPIDEQALALTVLGAEKDNGAARRPKAQKIVSIRTPRSTRAAKAN